MGCCRMPSETPPTKRSRYHAIELERQITIGCRIVIALDRLSDKRESLSERDWHALVGEAAIGIVGDDDAR